MKTRDALLRSTGMFLSVFAASLSIVIPLQAAAQVTGQSQLAVGTASTTLPTAQASTTATSTLLFLGNQNIAPVVFIEDNMPTGVAVDIAEALAPYLSRPLEVRAMDWPTAQALVAEGKADALIQINQTEERKKIYDFSDTLLESQFSVFAKADRVDISGVSSLHGLKVGVEKGGLPEQVLKAHPEIQLVAIPNFLEGFRQLNEGVIDAVVVDYRVGSYLIAKNNIQGIRVTGEPITFSYSAIAVKKGNTKLLTEINAALQTIKANGMYQAILTKWKPTEAVFQTEEQFLREILYTAIGVLLVLFLITTAWALVLQRERARRRGVEIAEQKAKKYTEKIISSANAMIIGLDLEGKVTLFNEMAENISGYRKEEVMGRDWFELIVPHDRFPEVWKVFEEFQKQKKSIVGEFQNPILTKSGEERLIEWRNSDLYDDGNVIGTISFGIDITERRKAEKELQRASEEIQDLYDHAPCGYHSLDIDGVFVRMNETELDWIGYQREEVIGKMRFTDIITENSKVIFKENFPKFKAAGFIQDLEFEIIRKDGSILPVLASATAVTDKDGNYLMSRSTLYDMTERKQAEKERGESEQRFTTVFNTSPDLMSITRISDGKILEINEGYSHMLGYSRDESLGKTTAELSIWANPTDRDLFVAALQKDGQVTDFETVLRRKDGTTVTVIDSARPFSLQGEACILSTAHDITDRKRVEVALRETTARLAEAQRMAHIGSWELDLTSNTLTWSDEIYRMFEIDKERFGATYEAFLNAIHPEDREAVNAAYTNSLATKKPYSIDHRLAFPDGRIKYVHEECETFYDENDKAIRSLGTVQDVTERKLEEERLKELDKLKDDFLMVTTHELKSPLIPIKSQSQLLLAGDYGMLTKEQKDAIEMIQRNEESLNVLASELLDISKIKSNKLKLALERVEVGALVAEVVGDMKTFAKQKNLTLSLLPTPKMSEIMVDGSRVRQVVRNLLDNAIKFTPEGGVVSVEVRKDGEGVAVSVRDSGIGIAKEDIPKLFVPFFRAESDVTRKYRGTGLGLAVSKGLVEAHGGKILAESEGEGKGSAFTFTLPIT